MNPSKIKSALDLKKHHEFRRALTDSLFESQSGASSGSGAERERPQPETASTDDA